MRIPAHASRALMLALPTILATLTLAQPLQIEFEELLSDSKLQDKLELSVTVIDAETGSVLAAHDSSRSLIPASNMKLLTSGTALSVLGPDFEFETTLELIEAADGARVVIRGAGDPAFGDPDLLDEMGMTIAELLGIWTDAIVNATDAPIVEIIADDRVFDRQFVHPTWPEAQLNRRYCAQVSGLNFHGNVLRVFTKPEATGRPPVLATQPEAKWVRLENRAKTVGRGKQHTAWAARAHGTNEITIFGDVRYSSTPIDITLHDNAMHLATLLADRVGKRTGQTPEARVAETTEQLGEGRSLHVVRSPLLTVLERCNEDSENLYAESLIKRVGHDVGQAPGSWSNGAAVVRMVLNDRVGVTAGAQIVVADGSGMSRENRVTTELLAAWVRSLINDERLAEAFTESLPIAGDEGTLANRFQNTTPSHEVRAKSGYLSGVSALTGVIEDSDTGRRAVFSIIANKKPNSVPLASIRALEEKIVIMVDAWASAEEDARLGG